MKKMLILLLFIPILSYSQISYKDVMSIKSVDTFKKVVIENGYEFDSTDDDWITYGFNISRDSIDGNQSTKWGFYDTYDGMFMLQFSRTSVVGEFFGSEDNSENPYDLIVEDIKEKCKYYKIINFGGTDYVTYSCSESLYKGKIGFMIEEGWGFITHFPPSILSE